MCRKTDYSLSLSVSSAIIFYRKTGYWSVTFTSAKLILILLMKLKKSILTIKSFNK